MSARRAIPHTGFARSCARAAACRALLSLFTTMRGSSRAGGGAHRMRPRAAPARALATLGSPAVAALLLAGSLAAPAGAQSKTGTTFASFLRIEPSARLAALGNAGVTFHDEIQSAWFNPAAAASIEHLSVQASHGEWYAGVDFDHVAAGIPLGGWGSAVASVTSLDSGEMDVRTVDQPLGTGERYRVSDIAIGLAYARNMTDRFALGGQVTWVQETIWHSSASTVTFALGTRYRLSASGLEIGSSLTNFGTRARFDGRDLRISYDQDDDVAGDNGTLPGEVFTESFAVPVLFRVGLGLPLRPARGHVVRLAADALHPSDATESVSLGAEWAFRDLIALRAGWQDLGLEDSEVGLTLGAGLQFDVGESKIRADYGWAGHDRLGDVHRLGLSVGY